MTARDNWKAVQTVIGTKVDGIPGPKDDAALAALRASAVSEYQASQPKPAEELGFMDGSSITRRSDGVIQFFGGMQINADGSPRAYGPNGLGLDYLANAGKPGNWWALVTDHGIPVVQNSDDPAPGYYISMTALENTQFTPRDPRRYMNSETVPFIVLPSNFPVKVKLGAKCRVTDQQNGISVDAIYADIGPRFQLGEGSIALANKLGINSDPKRGGTDRKLLYEILPA